MTQLLQNALMGTALILAVVFLRRAANNRLLPEIRLVLWAVCLLRLLTPAAPSSILSLWGLPKLLSRPTQPAISPAPGGPEIPSAVAPAIPAPQETAQPSGLPLETVLFALWLTVAVILAVRYVVSWWTVRRTVARTAAVSADDPRYALLPRFARLREGNMDGAPLTFGAARPTVVLTPGLSGVELECVLAHEGVHARRRDNLWHYAMAAALSVHWWNPAVWLMARMLRRDIELSCDRAVLRRLGPDRRADYAKTLVSMAVQAKGPAFCHTFGRKAVEERVFAIMKFKKTSVLGISMSLLLAFSITAAFASNPVEPSGDSPSDVPETNRSNIFYRDEDGTLSPIDPSSLISAVTFVDLRTGMSRDEVHQLLGDPAAELSGADGEVFALENGITVTAYYDAQGKVTRFQAADRDGTIITDQTDDSQSYPLWTDPNESAAQVPYEDYTPVDPDSISLDKLKEYLSQRVADGELTQAEADRMLADAADMLEQAKNGDIDLFMLPEAGGAGEYVLSSANSFDNVQNCADPDCQVSGEHHHENGTVVHHYCALPLNTEQATACPVEGCTEQGFHNHDGVVYACNGAHSGGPCGGTCPRSLMPAASTGHHADSHHSSGHHSDSHH